LGSDSSLAYPYPPPIDTSRFLCICNPSGQGFGGKHIANCPGCHCDSEFPHGVGKNYECPLVIPEDEWRANEETRRENAQRAIEQAQREHKTTMSPPPHVAVVVRQTEREDTW
jgi:hypothetical protein